MTRIRHALALPAALLWAALALPSCSSILEDRRECPGWLSFDLQEDCGLSGKDQASLYVFEGDSTVARETAVPLEEFTPEGYSVAVPRGHVDAAGVVGGRPETVRGRQLAVSPGSDYDPVYLFRGDAVAGEEEARLPVSLHKEHARLEISFANDGTQDYPYRIRIRGSSAGIDLVTGAPVAGNYDCWPKEPESGVFRCILPRQEQPRNLRLDLYSRDKDDNTGNLESSVALQPYIAHLRDFSWEDPDLKDIRIRFDFASSQVMVTLGDWKDGCVVSLRI